MGPYIPPVLVQVTQRYRVRKPRIDVVVHAFRSGNTHQTKQEPIGNPLALLANASDATQTFGLYPMSHNHLLGLNGGSFATKPQTCQVNSTILCRQLLHQPGYVSLGLQLDRETLEQGLDAILAASALESGTKTISTLLPGHPLCDFGPDIDPLNLGLVTMEEACHFFPVYGVIFCMMLSFVSLVYASYFSRCIQSMGSSMLCFTPRSLCALNQHGYSHRFLL